MIQRCFTETSTDINEQVITEVQGSKYGFAIQLMNKSLHEQVITEVQGSKYGFAIQLDKTTDV